MARGSQSKEIVFKKIAEAFGNDWIGVIDNKGYVWMQEGGERLQIAIALTCPKNMVNAEAPKPLDFGGSGFDFENMGATVAPKVEATAEITQQEQDDLATLLAKFGL